MTCKTLEQWLEAVRASGVVPDATVGQIARLAQRLKWQEWDELFTHLAVRRLISLYAARKIQQGKAQELQFGPYLFLDKLGEGGMGKVYLARRQTDKTIWAVKVVRPHLLAHPVIRRRYEREVAASMRFDHPNIVRVVEAGQHEGRHYLVMEYIDGIDLGRLTREYGPLAIPEACEYVRQAALGLQHAHDAGFVHRDIKPSNIMVAGERHLPQSLEPAVVKILDMGLVRAMGAGEDEAGGVDLTRDGGVVGTPDYMAPEQAKNSRLVDPRADLYSLGCTLYFALTGRPPYPDGTAIEKLLKHQLDPIPPVAAGRPDVPPALIAVLEKLMCKQPHGRFACAAEVAAALEPFCHYPFELRPSHIAVPATREDGRTGQSPSSVPEGATPAPAGILTTAAAGATTTAASTANVRAIDTLPPTDPGLAPSPPTIAVPQQDKTGKRLHADPRLATSSPKIVAPLQDKTGRALREAIRPRMRPRSVPASDGDAVARRPRLWRIVGIAAATALLALIGGLILVSFL